MLTDTKLRALKPRTSAYRLADANGLCIEVRPSGAKAWWTDQPFVDIRTP